MRGGSEYEPRLLFGWGTPPPKSSSSPPLPAHPMGPHRPGDLPKPIEFCFFRGGEPSALCSAGEPDLWRRMARGEGSLSGLCLSSARGASGGVVHSAGLLSISGGAEGSIFPLQKLPEGRQASKSRSVPMRALTTPLPRS